MSFGTGGLTQFADTNGNVQVNQLQQDGYAAGQLSQRLGQQRGPRGRHATPTAATSTSPRCRSRPSTAPNFLKRIDGGTFEVTNESGEALFGKGGSISGVVAGILQHRHRRRIHQADRHPAGLFGQHQGDHHRQHHGAGSAERDAMSAHFARRFVSFVQPVVSHESRRRTFDRNGRLAGQPGRDVAGVVERRQRGDAGLRPQDRQSGHHDDRRVRHRRLDHRRQPRTRRTICRRSCAPRPRARPTHR